MCTMTMAVVVFLTFGLVLGGTAAAQPAAGRVIAGNTPRFASTGKDLGREDASNLERYKDSTDQHLNKWVFDKKAP